MYLVICGVANSSLNKGEKMLNIIKNNNYIKRFFKLGKRMMAFFIVMLLSINTYAAVGASDGSAFVTKTEFETLIKDFNEQMNTYQSGLNTKIDSAIAAYLAGLSSEQLISQENLYNIACKFNKNQIKYKFMKAGFEPENTSLPTGCEIGGEYYFKNNDGSLNIWFNGSSATGNGKMYMLDNYGGMKEYYQVHLNVDAGGAWSGGVSGKNMTRTTITTSPTEYGSYSKSISMPGRTFLAISGYSKIRSNVVELNGEYVYPTISSTQIYYVKEEDKDKLTLAGTLSFSGRSSNTVLGIQGNESTSFTGSGSWQFQLYHPKYTYTAANEVICNSGASQASGATIFNYEGIPFVKCDTAGNLKFVVKWTTPLATQNYVQTGIRKNSGFANDGVVIIDPALKTNLDNNVIEANKEVEIIVKEVNKNDVFWIKGIPITADYAELDIVSVGVVKT